LELLDRFDRLPYSSVKRYGRLKEAIDATRGLDCYKEIIVQGQPLDQLATLYEPYVKGKFHLKIDWSY